MKRKGQNIRLFIKRSGDVSELPVAAAVNMTLHIQATAESTTTKDTDDAWDENEVTAISFSIVSDSLVVSDTLADAVNITDMEDMMIDETGTVDFMIAVTDGSQNREVVEAICSGHTALASLSLNAQNRQNSTLSATFQDGELWVGYQYIPLLLSDGTPVQTSDGKNIYVMKDYHDDINEYRLGYSGSELQTLLNHANALTFATTADIIAAFG